MNEILQSVLTFLYASVSVISLIGYFPTIKDLIQGKPSANIPSYILWTFATGITLLYSYIVLPDKAFQIVSFVNFLACAVVLVLSIRIRN